MCTITIITIIISAIALILSGINTYRQFFYRKKLVFLTPAESKSSDHEIRLIVVYTNAGNQPMNIINTSIRLNGEFGYFDKANHSASKDSINPIFIKGYECKAIEISYNLPNDVDYKKNSQIEIELLVSFTNKKGELCQERFIIGFLQTNKHMTRPFIYNEGFKIKEGIKIKGSISV
ncbi:hypothetical protein D0T84_07535 [Dysgonomonas sp. 521]|uniref:hypothetical protein n=1 Tax=Dysgonomonas sp. 521 TaxID=2302932 RepID=UPI0013D30A36|nr:hypothetical protein [Dysgonomonas sp. 521]NDV94770.1 hypothetical protein [Dysgonomonas sp. 521]